MSSTSLITRDPIQLLPPHLINKISAGEVVERPASVIKELVENALDAGATRIDVMVGAGGRSLRVADNGHGMTPEDVKLAFVNHATSKIRSEEDLNQINTLGFRGEALASIAAISKLICYTRTPEASVGTKVCFASNGELETSETGCAVGTIFEINELFYNTPARLKFMKRPATELSHIQEMVENLALSHPAVQFSLTLNDKNALKTSGSGQLSTAIDEVFGFSKVGQTLVPIDKRDPDAGYALVGLTSEPGVMKASKRWLVTFVNKRAVRCGVLSKAIESAYESLLPSGRYPCTVLFLNLPLEEVDVNVHPTKREVRYASNNTIFSFVRTGIKSALEAAGFQGFKAEENLITPAHFQSSTRTALVGNGSFMRRPERSYGSVPTRPLESSLALGLTKPLGTSEAFSEDTPGRVETLSPSECEHPKFKVLGQLFNTYILLETIQGLMVVDQHIASERELFEAFSTTMLSDDPPVQHLAIAPPLSITPTQADLLVHHVSIFAKLGFSYAISDTTLLLKTVPILYQERHRDPIALFENLLTQLAHTGEMRLDLDHTTNNLIATLACHAAVRAGDILSMSDMQRVVAGWLACKLPWTCPHGRPIAHTISKDDLNKFFHRPSLPGNSL